MARYPSRSYNRRQGRIRRRIEFVSVLVTIAVAIVFIYGRHLFSKSDAETFAALRDQGSGFRDRGSGIGVRGSGFRQQRPEVENSKFEIRNSKFPPQAGPDPCTLTTEPRFIAEAMTLIPDQVGDTKPSAIIEARDKLNQALSMHTNNQQQAAIKLKLSELAEVWLFSRTVFVQDRLCSNYSVKPGDLLRTIGQQHKVPWEILKEINRIHRPELLKAGETIKVIHGPFHARIYRSTFTMDLYLQDTFIRSFPVGLGKPGRETPAGLWVVKPGGKLISPPWTDPDTLKRYQADDPDYPLGSRWIALEGIDGQAKGRSGFAIHGTKKPEQIGTAGSRGCIRLRDDDAILIYNLLMPGLSQVQVLE